MLSLKYSSLVDVLHLAHYNIHMDESSIVDLIAIETDTPKHRITRSAGAIYAVLILLIIGCISLGNLLYDQLQISRYITQPALYLFLAAGGYLLYRRNFIRFRYTLTNESLAIEQIGRVETNLAAIPLNDIISVQEAKTGEKPTGRTIRATLAPISRATRVQARVEGMEITYAIGASEAFIHQLREALQSVKFDQPHEY